jgi:transposase
LLQAIYGFRSDRILIEQLDKNLLIRGFVGLNFGESLSQMTTFTKNHDRLLNEELITKLP